MYYMNYNSKTGWAYPVGLAVQRTHLRDLICLSDLIFFGLENDFINNTHSDLENLFLTWICITGSFRFSFCCLTINIYPTIGMKSAICPSQIRPHLIKLGLEEGIPLRERLATLTYRARVVRDK